jgi:hypothetical protein
MAQISRQMRFPAGPLTFLVQHELWDGNIEDHADQGVAIMVAAPVDGAETPLLRFNCFDIEKSYIYGPENATLTHAGPAMLGQQERVSHGPGQLYPYSDTCRTCFSSIKVYGCLQHHFPLSLEPGKPRFYVCKFGQHTKVTL